MRLRRDGLGQQQLVSGSFARPSSAVFPENQPAGFPRVATGLLQANVPIASQMSLIGVLALSRVAPLQRKVPGVYGGRVKLHTVKVMYPKTGDQGKCQV